MILSLQRYNFESNSQRVLSLGMYFISWYYHCKDTILKAIHNTCLLSSSLDLLILSLQRYNFESNSQRKLNFPISTYSWYYHCKDTILKAIHNEFGCDPFNRALILSLQRYNFESNSQLVPHLIQTIPSWYYHCKDTILKAIHYEFFIFPWNLIKKING